jgi:uncharacterized OB-fold protein
MSYPKPLPVIDHLSAPFWEGCKAHELRLQRCRACGALRFPAGPVCLQCRSPKADWVPSKGRGRVYSWIVVRHPVPAEIYAQDVPYVVALVELDEGVRMPTNVVGCPPEEVTAGMPVEVVFRDVNAEVSLPQFKPSVGRG